MPDAIELRLLFSEALKAGQNAGGKLRSSAEKKM